MRSLAYNLPQLHESVVAAFLLKRVKSSSSSRSFAGGKETAE